MCSKTRLKHTCTHFSDAILRFLSLLLHTAAKEGEHSEASKTETRRRRPKTSKSAIALERKGKCYGCGHPLQTDDAEAAGYVEEASFAKKQQHKQLDRVLCVRCHKLNNGSMIPAVEDVGLRDSSADVSPPGIHDPAVPLQLTRPPPRQFASLAPAAHAIKASCHSR